MTLFQRGSCDEGISGEFPFDEKEVCVLGFYRALRGGGGGGEDLVLDVFREEGPSGRTGRPNWRDGTVVTDTHRSGGLVSPVIVDPQCRSPEEVEGSGSGEVKETQSRSGRGRDQ